MGLVSGTVPNYINGVSEQAYLLRLASQLETQVNGFSSLTQGLQKRYPTTAISYIDIQSENVNVDDALFIHTINRDDAEKYIVVISDGDLKVFGLDGTQYNVAFPHGKDYLIAPSPNKHFRALSIADYTFIVNNSIGVAENTFHTEQQQRAPEALVNVRIGNYGKTYKVFLNGSLEAEYTTPLGQSVDDLLNISTDYIANELYLQLDNNVGFNYQLYVEGSVIYISRNSDFILLTTDDFNSEAMIGIKGKLSNFNMLPNTCPVDAVHFHIAGDNGTATDDYYIRYNKADDIWEETCSQGLTAGALSSHMPHHLIRLAGGSFSFEEATWGFRKVGDETSNPLPSFIGHTIKDIFFYRNRLGFLSDEQVIFSVSGDFYNLFRSTARQLVDSDVIDVSVKHTEVSILERAVPFNKSLMLFSANTQFIIEDSDILSPRTIAIKVASSFPISLNCAPVVAGKSLLTTNLMLESSSVFEYYLDNSGLNHSTNDITGHVPNYLPKNITKMTVSSAGNALCLIGTDEPNRIYLYSYYWAGEQKLQSSWSYWEVDSDLTVVNLEFIDNSLFIITRDSYNNYLLEKLHLTSVYAPSVEPYNILLDRKRYIAETDVVYNIGLDRTELTDGFNWSVLVGQTELEAVTCLNGAKPAGIHLKAVKDPVTYKIYIEGDYSGNSFILGIPYTFSAELSTITMKKPGVNNTEISVVDGRLQLRFLTFECLRTGYLKATITALGRDPVDYIYSGKTIGTGSAIINQIAFEDGRFIVPIQGRNTTTKVVLSNDKPVENNILNSSWEGFYNVRARAV